jgi:hypothetical protein
VDLIESPSTTIYTIFQITFTKGNSNTPVSYGCDGDAIADVAFSAMTSNPFGVSLAGQVPLIWDTN